MNRALCYTATLLLLATSPLDGRADVDEYMTSARAALSEGDIVNAMSLFRKAAELGHAPAQVQLARMLDKSEQNTEAADWYARAAEQDDAEAQFELGHLYGIGEGVDPDNQQAEAWIRKAAEQNYPPAMRFMAISHMEGQLDIAVDHGQAVAWLRRAAEQGDMWSMRRLAEAYRKGELGLPVDAGQAGALEQALEQAQ